MEKEISAIVSHAENALQAVDTADVAALPHRVEDLKSKFIGKNSEINNVYRLMKNVAPADRPVFGKLVNDAKKRIEDRILSFESACEELVLRFRLSAEQIDVTLPGKSAGKGALHPLTLARNLLTDYFISLGFEVADGPEIETDYYNFEALNTPADHPARDAQDTFYIDGSGGKYLLRSQTSATQIRTMENKKPPIKMIAPGRVYRADEVDATHSPVFHQLEGLVVDKGITMCDLKGILDALAKHLFGESVATRFRPSFFPFTEPSVEVDASCVKCGGKGCKACRGAGWIEVLGAGMVNRAVLRNCGIDPQKYSGFAFGVGIDRIANLLYGINDMRVLFENDVRFLRQFR
ncbi:MAG: phenylalanine--tRNA ligase subunit alpha [Clostridiales bacterium]|nr:phenylalanine--tRNA ligase subunit alpha [Clostridiales bacterium]